MIKSTVVKILILALSLIIIGLYVRHGIKKDDELVRSLNSEYPLVTYDEQLVGRVSDIFMVEHFRHDPDFSRITIENSIKKSVYVFSDEYDNYLSDVLKLNSYFLKKANSDSIYVYNSYSRDTLIYAFKLR